MRDKREKKTMKRNYQNTMKTKTKRQRTRQGTKSQKYELTAKKYNQKQNIPTTGKQ